MTPLPTAFDGNRDQKAFHFRQLWREGQVVLLEKQFKPEYGESDRRWYEVVLVRTVPLKRWPDGRTTESHEAMPRPEDWGVYGWSYSDLDTAKAKFKEILSKPLTTN